jgi:hypothetical protein
MFSIRPEVFGRKDFKGHAFAILPEADTNSTNFYNWALTLLKNVT